MEFTSKYLNSVKTLHSLKTFHHPNTLLDNEELSVMEFKNTSHNLRLMSVYKLKLVLFPNNVKHFCVPKQ